MKFSEFLREHQRTGQLPDVGGDSQFPYYAGWIMGASVEKCGMNLHKAIEFAIHLAEFVEAHAFDA